MKTKTTLSLLAALSLFSVVGCDDKAGVHDFFPDQQERKTQLMIDAQTSAGAKADATLHDVHFTGSKLNTLGESKLDLMLPDEQSADLVVYVALPAGDLTDSRKSSVADYLRYRGMDASHVKLVDGPNPSADTPSANSLSRILKTESNGDSDASGSSATGAMQTK
jgi:hypothetical protein